MNGWILLVRDGSREWACWGVLEAMPTELYPELPAVLFAPRTAVQTPAPLVPADCCWAFASEQDASTAQQWLEQHGYVVRTEYHTDLVVL